MKNRTYVIALVQVLLFAVCAAAAAATAPGMFVHIEKYTEVTCSDDMSALTAEGVSATYDGVGRINAFIVLRDYKEVIGAAFGLDWPETWLDPMWQDCGAVRIGAIKNPGDQTTVMFEECKRGGEPVVIGWLSVTVTSPGTIELLPSEAEGAVAIVDCDHRSPGVYEVMFTGMGGAGGARGTDPSRFIDMKNRTWHVRADSTGDAPTINRAVRQSIPGDTVAVAAGTYRETVYLRNGVAITGGWDQDFTARDPGAFPSIITPAGEGTCVIGGLREDTTCVLDGFTITGGHGHYGGGLALRGGSSPVVRNLVIYNNRADLGGGVFCNASSPLFENVLIFSNEADMGGAFACNVGASPRIVRATIAGNSADAGAAVFANGASPYLENCIIAHNSGGEAISAQTRGSTVTFACCDLWDNRPSDFGGFAGPEMGLKDNVAVDPMFLDREAFDFGLSGDSPCRDVPDCGRIGSSLTRAP